MRELKWIGFVFCLFLYGCSDHEEDTTFLSLTRTAITFDWTGNETEMVEVIANEEWDMSSVPDWLTLELKENGGNSSLYFTAEPNETESGRSCILIFFTQTQEQILSVTQMAKSRLGFSGEKEYYLGFEETELEVGVEANVRYDVGISVDWITSDERDGIYDMVKPIGRSSVIGGTNHSLIFGIAENNSKESRTAQIVISNKTYSLADTLNVIQEGNPNEYYMDGSYLQIKQATRGNGVNLFLMGDGFTQKSLIVGGRYENVMRQAADYFFSIEPYYSYRDYFNVYAVIAESKEEGVNGEHDKRVDTKFQSEYGNGTAITCNDELCFEYAKKVKDVGSEPMTLIVILNSEKYAGTTYLYSDGNSIALCPMSKEKRPNDFEGVIHHEAGGHGFGFLCDEYVYYQRKMPESRKRDIRAWQELGFQLNLDFTEDLSEILWKDFIGIDKYNNVGAFEGGYEYQYGVWRSEENSCMNNNIPYFNVQSRRIIVERIMKLAGEQFILNDFINKDNVSVPSEEVSRATTNFVQPLGEPIWIRHDINR